VRISDRALVVAAELSDRYITTRYLPDKAIDLWVSDTQDRSAQPAMVHWSCFACIGHSCLQQTVADCCVTRPCCCACSTLTLRACNAFLLLSSGCLLDPGLGSPLWSQVLHWRKAKFFACCDSSNHQAW